MLARRLLNGVQLHLLLGKHVYKGRAQRLAEQGRIHLAVCLWPQWRKRGGVDPLQETGQTKRHGEGTERKARETSTFGLSLRRTAAPGAAETPRKPTAKPPRTDARVSAA